MITLKNVSKYYYQHGMIASGFTKVNLKFDIGEFVAITGESGSGKSTLLNVISGLDSYEEGEMYIDGHETSHYTERDFEEYRRTYISNIFQNFNLVNSYTVLQNIELVLYVHGFNKKDARTRAIALIKKVGLIKYKNTKASKLSGGQKQRVAIARALAKETPIIIADEPTGNLDSKTAREILKLLHDISKEKLVVIVTHNYDQVEPYVTRKIKMHDGRVLEDKVLKETNSVNISTPDSNKHITLVNKFRLGIRNTFNIIPKFLLVLAVYLFVVVAVMGEYSYFKKNEYLASKSGYNQFFSDTKDTRLVLKKRDLTSFTEDDYNYLGNLEMVDYVVRNDLLLDNIIEFNTIDDFYLSGRLNSIDNFKATIGKGRMPEADNEIFITSNKDSYYYEYYFEDFLDKEVYMTDMYGNQDKNNKLKVVGYGYEDNSDYSSKVYVSNSILDKMKNSINQQYSNLKVLFLNHYNNYRVIPNSNVGDGSVIINESLNVSCKNENCLKENLKIEVNNLYYKDELNLVVNNTFNKVNMEKLLSIKEYDDYGDAIFISQGDYNRLFDKPNYQSSLFVDDFKNVEVLSKQLEDKGYNVLKMGDTLVNSGAVEAIQIFKAIVTGILFITLFFIAYFVISIILKSRNIYFGTIRILGATKKEAKQLLIIELLTVSNLAFFSFLGLVILEYYKLINYGMLTTIIKYLTRLDFLILYVVITLMSYLISLMFARKIFKNSAMKTMREEI